MKKRILKWISLSLVFVIIAVSILVYLSFKGVICLNAIPASKYSVKGIDVSSWQGDIDWEILSNQGASFVFIKATEGSTFVDKKFAYNFKKAQENGFDVGAYHFFSYESSGKEQAENFIKTVEPFDGMLPPVVDVEFYGDKYINPPLREKVEPELKMLLDTLEEHYQQKPIIYATERSYKLYLKEGYEKYDIWMSNKFSKPTITEDKWSFWQYTDKEKLEGYNGDEEFIDVNVFNGNEDDYNAYLEMNTYKRSGD